MKERPILMQTENVQAILDGRKTQTRRVIKPQPELIPDDVPHDKGQHWWWASRAFQTMVRLPDDMGCMPSVCPYGQVSDRLWVRETWWNNGFKGTIGTHYKASCDLAEPPWKWKPSIFMPRWASRTTLEITEIRVERVQEISGNGCLSEGINKELCRDWHHDNCFLDVDYARELFQELWDSINGKKYPWSSNPWVWVILFREEVAR